MSSPINEGPSRPVADTKPQHRERLGGHVGIPPLHTVDESKYATAHRIAQITCLVVASLLMFVILVDLLIANWIGASILDALRNVQPTPY